MKPKNKEKAYYYNCVICGQKTFFTGSNDPDAEIVLADYICNSCKRELEKAK